MEWIYRNYAPKGSSVFKRLEKGMLKPEHLGLAAAPTEGQKLPRGFRDGSTKYEAQDDYPQYESMWERFMSIGNLSREELDKALNYLDAANSVISKGFETAGFINCDGKIEMAFNPFRTIMVVDTLGTLDECRIWYNGPAEPYRGVDVSKQIPRDHYADSEWKNEIDVAKKSHPNDWKDHVTSAPEPLPHALKEILENLYPSVANCVIGRELFSGIPNVEEILGEYDKFKKAEME